MRRWAYEEVLFGSAETRARMGELAAGVAELEAERVELAALHESLDTHLDRISELEQRLHRLTADAEPGARTAGIAHREDVRGASEPETHRPSRRPTLPHPRAASFDDAGNGTQLEARTQLLARCEGFDVEAPGGLVGFVEGVRFGSRIDCPDVLEVRGGRFGRHLFLVPVEEVVEIRLDDRCVTLGTAPALETDLLDDLGDRLRRVLHFDSAAS